MMMEYPKPVMSIPELAKMGFPRDLLYQAAHAKGSGSFKNGTGGKTSTWFFRTTDFDAWLNKLGEDQKR